MQHANTRSSTRLLSKDIQHQSTTSAFPTPTNLPYNLLMTLLYIQTFRYFPKLEGLLFIHFTISQLLPFLFKFSGDPNPATTTGAKILRLTFKLSFTNAPLHSAPPHRHGSLLLALHTRQFFPFRTLFVTRYGPPLAASASRLSFL